MMSAVRFRSLRAALLGAVAVAAIGGVAFERALIPVHAVAATSEPMANPSAPSAIAPRGATVRLYACYI